MRIGTKKSFLAVLAFALASFTALSAPASAQDDDGIVTGHVVDADSDETVPGANVLLEGTGLGAATNAEGEYTITDVPAGEYILVVRFVGFRAYRGNVIVESGETVEENIRLTPDRLGLEEVIVTGQGSAIESKRLSTTTETITAAEIEANPARRVDELLQGQLPGAQVRFSSGQPGTASLIRGRGVVSASQSTTPVIYVDGVRVDNLNTASSLSVGTGGAQSSAFPDIPIENIERIEYVKGGAATTLYGSDAANGVIQIFTKDGVSGTNTFTYEGTVGASVGTEDFLFYDETADALFEPGFIQEHRITGNGGSEDVTYSFSGSASEDNGFRLGNQQKQFGIRSTVAATLRENLRYRGSLGFSSNDFTRDYNANSNFSAFQNLESGSFGDLASLEGEDLDAQLDLASGRVGLVDNQFDVRRFQTSQKLEYDPLAGLTMNATLGLDYRVSEEQGIISPAFLGFIGSDPSQSSIQRVNRRFFGITAELTGQHTADVGDFSFVTTAGGQLFRDQDEQDQLIANGTPLGTRNVDTGASTTSSDFELVVANYGVYLQENIGFLDRYFVEGGLRVDGNSAFGESIGSVVYPKVGASYVLSDEPFFQDNIPSSVISNVKLRANLGYAGNFPSPFVNQREVTAAPFLGSNAFTFGQFGNENLEPEQVRTVEVGGNFAFLNQRVSLDVTYFNSRTENALFNIPFAPSTGRNNQDFNVGEIENSGFEIASQFFAIERDNFTLDFNASVNTLNNEVLSTGGAPPFSLGGFNFLGQFVEEGQPVGYLRGNNTILNEDGNVQEVEQNVSLGSPIPDVYGSVGVNMSFFDRLSLRVTGDYQSGAQGVNTDDVLRFFSGLESGERFPGDAPPAVPGGFFDLASFFVEDTDYFKIRLISLNYSLPDSWFVGSPVRGVEAGFRVTNPFNFVESSFDPEVTGANAPNQDATNVGVFGFGTESPPRQYLFNAKITL